MSEVKLLVFCLTSLRARSASSEQQVLVKTETITTSYEARKLLRTTNGKKHDQVTHLGLGMSDSRKRLESDELYQHVQQQLRSAELLYKREEA